MKKNIAVNWLDRCKGVSGDFNRYLKKKKKELVEFDQCIFKGHTPNYCQIKNRTLKIAVFDNYPLLREGYFICFSVNSDERRLPFGHKHVACNM